MRMTHTFIRPSCARVPLVRFPVARADFSMEASQRRGKQSSRAHDDALSNTLSAVVGFSVSANLLRWVVVGPRGSSWAISASASAHRKRGACGERPCVGSANTYS